VPVKSTHSSAAPKQGSYLASFKAKQEKLRQLEKKDDEPSQEPVQPKPEHTEAVASQPGKESKPHPSAVPLYKALQSMIVFQNQNLKVLLSEEAFGQKCGDVSNSNLFGEDLSQLVPSIKNPMECLKPAHRHLMQQATEVNVNSSSFFQANKDWVEHEIESYLNKEEEKAAQENEVKMYLEA